MTVQTFIMFFTFSLLRFFTFYSSNTPEKSLTASTKILSSTNVFNIDDKRFLEQHIIMISEESCDTEDWSNDAENTALHHRNK